MGDPTTRAVLLVEDNPTGVYLTEKAMQECGDDIHLSVVSNGKDALAFLRHEGVYALAPAPALILLDLHLPKLHGLSVLAELRHLSAYQQTPVVIFSTAPAEIEEPRCLQAGATAYVQKPADLYALFAVVQDLVRTWLWHEGSP